MKNNNRSNVSTLSTNNIITCLNRNICTEMQSTSKSPTVNEVVHYLCAIHICSLTLDSANVWRRKTLHKNNLSTEFFRLCNSPSIHFVCMIQQSWWFRLNTIESCRQHQLINWHDYSAHLDDKTTTTGRWKYTDLELKIGRLFKSTQKKHKLFRWKPYVKGNLKAFIFLPFIKIQSILYLLNLIVDTKITLAVIWWWK